MLQGMDPRLTDRKGWANSFNRCWMCGARSHSGLPLETHEMERRSHGPQMRWAHRCNYFRACHRCHDGPLATMPHHKQLAYKLLADPKNYDLDSWLKIRDPDLRAPIRVTQQEVDESVETLNGELPWK